MADFDVIIVGGGPAGSSAAIHSAARGARVLLAEQKRFPREKLCGEFISPECDLDYTPNRARESDVRVALCNCIGFGSKNSALVVEKL